MATPILRVEDACIDKAARFAQPISAHPEIDAHRLPGRGRDHEVTVPHFVYRGVLCSMASLEDGIAHSGSGKAPCWMSRPMARR